MEFCFWPPEVVKREVISFGLKEGAGVTRSFFANPLLNFPEVSLWAKYQYKKNH